VDNGSELSTKEENKKEENKKALTADELDVAALVGDAEGGSSVACGSDYASALPDKPHVVAEASERDIAGRRRRCSQLERRAGRDAKANRAADREESITAALLDSSIVEDISDAVLSGDRTGRNVGQRDVAFGRDVRTDQSAADVRHAEVAHLRFDIHGRGEGYADGEIYVTDFPAALIVFDEIDVDRAAQALRFDVSRGGLEIGGDRDLVAVPTFDGDGSCSIKELKADVLICGIGPAEPALGGRVDREQRAEESDASS